MLERYFHSVAIESGEFTRIGRWWDRNRRRSERRAEFARAIPSDKEEGEAKGENEIDMIAEDELADSVTFYEIKRQKEEISLGVLRQKAEVFLQATHEFRGYDISYKGLSMEDM